MEKPVLIKCAHQFIFLNMLHRYPLLNSNASAANYTDNLSTLISFMDLLLHSKSTQKVLGYFQWTIYVSWQMQEERDETAK
jgi:hypothetical protein